MSNALTMVFRAHLTTAMDSVLQKALLKIMNIFENTLQDHQLVLAQKEDEITQLKVKLQALQIMLTERGSGHEQGKEMNQTQMNESQPELVCEGPHSSGQPELDNVNPFEQTSDIPEIYFEVPDDWCAPVGCKIAIKKEETMCPSVPLRQLYIPLSPLPLVKEVDNSVIDSDKQKKSQRKSKRISKLKESDKESTKTGDQATRQKVVTNDMLQEIKQGDTDITCSPKRLRRGEKKLRIKKEITTLKNPNVLESISLKSVENDSEKRFTCKFCTEVFDTPFDLSVHVRSHRQCNGCKKQFTFPCALVSHQRLCEKFKELLSEEVQSTETQPDDQNPSTSNKKLVITTNEKTPSSNSRNASRRRRKTSDSFLQKAESAKRHSCPFCNTRFDVPYKLKVHVRLHTGEKPYPCSMCTKKFRTSQSLRNHIVRMHKHQVDSNEIRRSFSWTMPIEAIEDEDLTSPSTNAGQEVGHNELEMERNRDRTPPLKWQEMGKRQAHGFICLLCKKFLKSKYFLIKHFRTHTTEKANEICP